HFRNYFVHDELPKEDGYSRMIKTVDEFNH
ncbi:unnamed protein product, partial [marine sediment metagenome]